MEDSNSLRSRDLRNRMEHCDEYRDDYFAKCTMVGHVIPDYIGPASGQEEVPYQLLMAYFGVMGRVSVLGVKFDFSLWVMRSKDSTVLWNTPREIQRESHK